LPAGRLNTKFCELIFARTLNARIVQADNLLHSEQFVIWLPVTDAGKDNNWKLIIINRPTKVIGLGKNEKF